MSAVLLCLVVAISDGDTLKVRCDDQPQQVIRLAEIDAPEKAQPFGTRSREHLASLCFQHPAAVIPQVRDRCGCTVARVNCEGKDASAEQVRAGVAWAYTKYLKDGEIKALEGEARADHRGLWADTSPTAQWEWRDRNGGGLSAGHESQLHRKNQDASHNAIIAGFFDL